MKRLPRRLAIAVISLLIGLLGLVIAAHVWLSAWVPTHGKAWLETTLARELPQLEVRIGALRYSWWRGFLLEEVTAVDPQTAVRWLDAPHAEARIGFLSFAIQRRIAFHLKAVLAAPCEIHLTVSGRYRMPTRQLALDLRTSDLLVERIAPHIAQRVPALKAGRLRLKLHADWQPDTAPVITGRVAGTAVTWEQTPYRITGDVVVNGTATPAADPSQPWSLDLTAQVDRTTLDGLPVIQGASQLTGTMRLVNDRLQITSLQGMTLGSLWRMEGTVTHLSHPEIDVTVRARANLPAITEQLGQFAAWQPRGEADLTITCRGALSQWPDLDVDAAAMIQDASLAIPKLTSRLEHIAGSLHYEHLTRRLTIASLSGQIRDFPVLLQGTVDLKTPATLDLAASTQADLAVLTDLLPADGPVQTLAGPVSVQLEVGGILSQPTWNSVGTLTDATVTLRAMPAPITGLRGTIRFTDQQISTERLTLIVAEQPITVSGAVTNLTTTPRIVGHATFTDGSLAVNAVLHDDHLLVNAADVKLGTSRLRIQGRVNRLPQQASQLTASGTLQLADLSRVPWVTLKGIEEWQLQGETAIQGRLAGPLDDWQSVVAAGAFRADEVTIRGVSVQQLAADVEQGQGRLSIRVTNALVASGKLVGEFLTEQQSDQPHFLLEGDLTMADLQQLVASIPAWRTRELQGTVSSHVSLVGTWKDRAGLRGDGWVQVEGERLGELPLLDRLFRGVFGALAERLGLTALRKAQITKVAGRWRLAQERVVTDDLRITGLSGTEPITVLLHGSVGLDKTLDLTVEPELSEQLLLQAPNTSALSNAILKVMGGIERARSLVGRHHLSGTIDNPQYKFEVNLDQILNQLLPSGLGQFLDVLRR